MESRYTEGPWKSLFLRARITENKWAVQKILLGLRMAKETRSGEAEVQRLKALPGFKALLCSLVAA